MATRLVELRNISKSFGSICALSGVNLSVGEGRSRRLIGDNGAGESTLIDLAGVVQPTSGEIVVRGRWSPLERRAVSRTVLRPCFKIAPAVQRSSCCIFMGAAYRPLAG